MVKRITSLTYTEAVTLAELRRQLRLAADAEADLLTMKLNAACQQIEEMYGVALLPTECKYVLDKWPVGDVILPIAPIATIDSIQYIDSDGTTQTLASDKYTADTVSYVGSVRFKECPAIGDYKNAITINFTSGWANASAIPSPVKEAILMAADTLYEVRQNEIVGRITSVIEGGTKHLMTNYTVML